MNRQERILNDIAHCEGRIKECREWAIDPDMDDEALDILFTAIEGYRVKIEELTKKLDK